MYEMTNKESKWKPYLGKTKKSDSEKPISDELFRHSTSLPSDPSFLEQEGIGIDSRNGC